METLAILAGLKFNTSMLSKSEALLYQVGLSLVAASPDAPLKEIVHRASLSDKLRWEIASLANLALPGD